MKQYVLKENDLTQNPITGKPFVGKGFDKYLMDSKREKMNQIERSNEKFYSKLKEYISSERKRTDSAASDSFLKNRSFNSSNRVPNRRNLSSDFSGSPLQGEQLTI